MALTKAEKQILKDFGNDPNYRIETNQRNQIVATQINPTKSCMQRFIDGEEFTLSKKVCHFPLIKFRFSQSQSTILNNDGADTMGVMAVFGTGILYKHGARPTTLISFTDVNFVDDDKR
nr:hypothetical protein [Pedobacter kyonggii]